MSQVCLKCLGREHRCESSGFSEPTASPQPTPPHVTRDWTPNWEPICVPECPACASKTAAAAPLSEEEDEALQTAITDYEQLANTLRALRTRLGVRP